MVQARTALAAPVLALAALAAAVRAESQCAQRVFDHPEEFAPCLEGGTVCFLFLSEGSLHSPLGRALRATRRARRMLCIPS
jgi:hypothetical protein